ncbi:MAG: isocitrate dehydrogenase [Candidatus Scalindua rubra]|uniref:Isocitrate dehydrogenase (NADP(+)) n=1 Tax=Candidatus Scalindua rubra TaxID=1872076 RepID=A0A1E3X7J4_9BACT|nr:MAG: isocitrate dehydrogenase [Candidatus Scalindua rubra]
MIKFKKFSPPKEGEEITVKDKKLIVPHNPIIPFIMGDGIGPDIMKVTRMVIDGAVEKAYSGKKKIAWYEIYAGGLAQEKFNELIPEDTFEAIRHYHVALKGPLATPVGKGHRSLNVTLRIVLDLYACVRPIRYFQGAPSPVRHPERVDMVIFRENTEDVYSGIEWKQGSKEVKQVIDYLNSNMGTKIRNDSGIGIKNISIEGTKRLVRKALDYAISQNRKSVTLVHKGNIMKFTEGAFRNWGYEVAREEYGDYTITEEELFEKYSGTQPDDKIVIKDRIADAMFQLVLTRPEEYDILAMPNLNGDYLSDACVAQVGGLGLAPSSNISDDIFIFEASHGTAPKYANQNKVNPGSLILTGGMMLNTIGFKEAEDLILKGIARTIAQKTVTYDLERQMEGATRLSTSEFGEKIIENM